MSPPITEFMPRRRSPAARLLRSAPAAPRLHPEGQGRWAWPAGRRPPFRSRVRLWRHRALWYDRGPAPEMLPYTGPSDGPDLAGGVRQGARGQTLRSRMHARPLETDPTNPLPGPWPRLRASWLPGHGRFRSPKLQWLHGGSRRLIPFTITSHT